MHKLITRAAVLLMFAALSGGCLWASPVYIGSFEVDQGPNWMTTPDSYSARQAAVLVFGGVVDEYYISIDPSRNPDTITYTGWYSVWGVPDGTEFGQDYLISTDGKYQAYGDASAWVNDNATGAAYTNYVWKEVEASGVPEPGSLAMLLSGMGLLWIGSRRRAR